MSATAKTAATATIPPIDAVFIWVTATVERDYQRRAVFPELRSTSPRCEVRYGGSRHRLTPVEAAHVLDDATAEYGSRSTPANRGTKVAYKALLRDLREAIQQSVDRCAMAASPVAICRVNRRYVEYWRGTKAQLVDKGIRLDVPWPGEPGGLLKGGALGVDWRGFQAVVEALRPWATYYEVWITIPAEHQNETPEKRREKADTARWRLKSMPQDFDTYRTELIGTLRSYFKIVIDIATKPASGHGYTLPEDALPEIFGSFDAIAEAVWDAAVEYDEVRHAEIARGFRATIAEGDTAFQARLAELVKPNAVLLDGGRE